MPLLSLATPSTLPRLGWLVMTVLSVGVALASLRYFILAAELASPPVILFNRINAPLSFLLHVAASVVALVVGPWQLSSRLRHSRPLWHRWGGRIYVAAVAIGGVSGLMIASTASSGPTAQWGFGMLAVLWLISTGMAVFYIQRRDIARHRVMMISSFALTFAAVTLRLYLPVVAVLPIPFSQWYSIVAWLCWVPNIVLVLGWMALRRP